MWQRCCFDVLTEPRPFRSTAAFWKWRRPLPQVAVEGHGSGFVGDKHEPLSLGPSIVSDRPLPDRSGFRWQ